MTDKPVTINATTDLCFPIRDAVRRELSWTHHRALIRIDSPQARDWYATEAAEQDWSVPCFA